MRIDTFYQNMKRCQKIIDALVQQGYQFVTVLELLAYNMTAKR